MLRKAAGIGSCLLVLALAGAVSSADDPPSTFKKEGFEAPKPSWRREQTDASVSIQAHDRSNRAAHEGRTSERFLFRAGPGSALYFSQPVPRVAISDDAQASLYVRANRPGVQLFGKVVLPADIDPETGRPSFLLIPGETLQGTDRWERLDLKDLRATLARQARILRLGTERRVSLDGAYLERLVVNLYGGAGETEVFLDDMTVGPFAEEKPDVEENPDPFARNENAEVKPDTNANPAAPDRSERPAPRPDRSKDTARVQILGTLLSKDRLDWFPVVVHAPGADPTALFQANVDVLALDRDTPERVAEEATRAGLLLMPTLDLRPGGTPETVVAKAETYPYRDHVAMWNLGDDLGASPDPKARKDELERVRRAIIGLHDLPDGRPRVLMGTVTDGLPLYALAGRNLDVFGVEAADWGTVRNPLDTKLFLTQRRDLTALKTPHAPHLAWIPVSAPPSASRNIWGLDEPPVWGHPQIQPEQIRMYAYAALSAGYRGLGFRAEGEITTEAGRTRLMEIALIAAELKLVEAILAKGPEPIQAWNVFERDPEQIVVFNPLGAAAGYSQQRSSPLTRPQKEVPPHPTVKAASIPVDDKRGKLILIADYAGLSQHQPPQSGFNDLKVMIQAPENAQALEITPAGIQVLPRERVTGGMKVTIPVFSGTSMVLVTTDLGIKARLERAVQATRPKAVEFAIEQARAAIRETAEINAQLLRDKHPSRDAEDLLQQADTHLKAAIEAQERLDYTLAWAEARWVGRSIRHLRRRNFEKAMTAANTLMARQMKDEDRKGPYIWFVPNSCPPLTAYQTLPELYTWLDTIQGNTGPFGENLLASGDFESGGIAEMAREGWRDVSHVQEDAEGAIQYVEGAGYGRERNDALRLRVAPKELDKKAMEKLVPFLDHPAAAVRSPAIPVVRDRLYRIRVLIRLVPQLPGGTGGIIVRDSIGGPAYEFRATDLCPFWREVTLYRLAPEDGTMTVTLGLAGYGEAYFDRLRIDAIDGGSSRPAAPRPAGDAPIARRPSPPSPNPPRAADGGTRPRR